MQPVNVYSECLDIVYINTIKNIFINSVKKQHLIHYKSINNAFFGFETSERL